jgi:hypothetical protein
MNNNLFERFVINYYGDLPTILKKLDIHVQHNGLFLCPMHDNYNTPAAKLFKDDSGWAFYCFNEQKQFGTYDVYKEICGYNMKVVFKTLWSQLTPGQQDMMQSRFGEFDDKAEIQSEQSFIKFSQKTINYHQLLQELEADLRAQN